MLMRLTTMNTMSTYEQELRECLGEILGESLPPPEADALRFYGQWLAERNLGLVPIADPGAFAWPGRWLARVRRADEDHAVVMYGAPSGPLVDPAGVLRAAARSSRDGSVARLDLELATKAPYGFEARVGSVACLLVAPQAEAPLVRIETARAVAGRGLEGDRYFAGAGTFSGPGRGYELTLVQAEASRWLVSRGRTPAGTSSHVMST